MKTKNIIYLIINLISRRKNRTKNSLIGLFIENGSMRIYFIISQKLLLFNDFN